MADSIHIGMLDRRVTAYEPDHTASAYGGTTVNWKAGIDLWAHVVEEHAEDRVAGRQAVSASSLTVTIRYHYSVDTDWKLRYDGEDYRIASKREIGRRMWHELKCERIGDEDGR